jgi:hypothetical protein
MTTEGDAQGQQAGCEGRSAIPVAPPDVAHGPRRDAGHIRGFAHRRPPDAVRDDPPDRVDPVEAAMQDALWQRAACPPAPPDSAAAGPGPGRALVPA